MLKSDGEKTKGALALHRKAVVIDLCERPIVDAKYFDELLSAGVTVANVTLEEFEFYAFGQAVQRTFQESTRRISEHIRWIEASADKALLAETVEDILRAKKEGKVAVTLAHQNTSYIGDDLNMIDVLYRLGVRMVQLTYNERNLVGDGCTETTDVGLSKFGRAVVKEMNRIGMIIDLSHCGDQTTLDAIEASEDPVIISHSNPRALCNNVRNKTDEMIKRAAEKGGIIGITTYHPLLGARKDKDVGLDDFLDHIDYVVNLVGIDHLGIGSDYGPGTRDKALHESRSGRFWDLYPEVCGLCKPGQATKGLEELQCYPNITKGLVERGYSEDDVQKILGGNSLRVFRQVWNKRR